MTALGVSLAIRAGRPRLLVVRSEAPDLGSPALAVVLEHLANDADDEVLQLHGIADAVETLLINESPEAVVVRRMDWNNNQKRELVAKRGQAEGVAAAAFRVRIGLTRLASGAEIGSLCKSNKSAVESAAEIALNKEAREAGGAALAASFLKTQYS